MQIKIGLLWHSLRSNNLGCGALSLANILILDDLCRKNGLKPHFVIGELPGTMNYEHELKGIDITSRPIPRIRNILTNPQSLRAIYEDCDLMVDIYTGDSFADIYGVRYFLITLLIRFLLLAKPRRYILAPQTIGPFKYSISKWLAKKLLLRAEAVFARDKLSFDYVKSISEKINVIETTDVAFDLPYQKPHKNELPVLKVGVNISGMLFNQMFKAGTHYSYEELIHYILRYFYTRANWQIHLIPHVMDKADTHSSDLVVIKKLALAFPGVIVPEEFASPVDAKSYIAGMDLFIGARMHATIAALSAGVPVIPISYSRKFEGLFHSLDYNYVVNALTESPFEIMAKINIFYGILDELGEKCNTANKLAQKKLVRYKNTMVDILTFKE